MIDKILNRYGVPAVVTHAGTQTTCHIFFQPSTSKSWQGMNPIMSPLGQIPGGQYLYIGPAAQEIAISDRVDLGGKAYIFRRCERYQDRKGPVYWWGLCVQKGSDDTWGSQA